MTPEPRILTVTKLSYALRFPPAQDARETLDADWLT